MARGSPEHRESRSAKPLGIYPVTFGEMVSNFNKSGSFAAQRRSHMIYAQQTNFADRDCLIKDKVAVVRPPGRDVESIARSSTPSPRGSRRPSSLPATPQRSTARLLDGDALRGGVPALDSHDWKPLQMGMSTMAQPTALGSATAACRPGRHALLQGSPRLPREELGTPRAASPPWREVSWPEPVAPCLHATRPATSLGSARYAGASLPPGDSRQRLGNGYIATQALQAPALGQIHPDPVSNSRRSPIRGGTDIGLSSIGLSGQGAETRRSSPSRGPREDRGSTNPRARSFVRLNGFLWRTHITSLISALTEDGWMEVPEKERLCARARENASTWAIAFLKVYTDFMETEDMHRFVADLRALGA